MVKFLPLVVADQIIESTQQGQTRYTELRAELGVDGGTLDSALMMLAKEGDVSLIAVGDVLNIRGHHHAGDRGGD